MENLHRVLVFFTKEGLWFSIRTNAILAMAGSRMLFTKTLKA